MDRVLGLLGSFCLGGLYGLATAPALVLMGLSWTAAVIVLAAFTAIVWSIPSLPPMRGVACRR
jgi:hypothetical protein